MPLGRSSRFTHPARFKGKNKNKKQVSFSNYNTAAPIFEVPCIVQPSRVRISKLELSRDSSSLQICPATLCDQCLVSGVSQGNSMECILGRRWNPDEEISSGMALPKPKLSCPIFPTRQQPQRSKKVALHFAADGHLTKDSTKKPFPKFHPTQHECSQHNSRLLHPGQIHNLEILPNYMHTVFFVVFFPLREIEKRKNGNKLVKSNYIH